MGILNHEIKDLKQEELITLAEEEILKSYYLDVDIKITKLGKDEI